MGKVLKNLGGVICLHICFRKVGCSFLQSSDVLVQGRREISFVSSRSCISLVYGIVKAKIDKKINNIGYYTFFPNCLTLQIRLGLCLNNRNAL